MNRWLLTLWVGGAALYTANTFVFVRAVNQADEIPSGPPPIQSPPSTQLPSNTQPQHNPETRPVPGAEAVHDQTVASEAQQTPALPPTPQESQPMGPTAADSMELVAVSRTAPVHDGPSVSAPTIRYVRAGTQLEVIQRSNGWARTRNPNSLEEGWVYEKPYLIETTSSMQEPMAEEPAANEAGITEASLIDEDVREVSRPQAKHHRSIRKHVRGKRIGRLRLFRRF